MSYKGSFSRAYAIHELVKNLKIKEIIHLHGSEFEKWFDECSDSKKEKIKKLLRECDKFIVLGKDWKRKITKIEPKTNTFIINNSVQIPRNTAKYCNRDFKILFLGVLIERKGVVDLIEAIKILDDKGKIDNAKFLVAGSGKEETNLKNRVKEYKIEKYFDFLGWIDNEKKKQLLLNSQALILPSYNEGLPMAILEAISYGLPVIATDVGDVSEAVINNENGYLCKAGDIESLSICIQKLLNITEKEWIRKSENSRKIAIEKFANEYYVKKIVCLYN